VSSSASRRDVEHGPLSPPPPPPSLLRARTRRRLVGGILFFLFSFLLSRIQGARARGGVVRRWLSVAHLSAGFSTWPPPLLHTAISPRHTTNSVRMSRNGDSTVRAKSLRRLRSENNISTDDRTIDFVLFGSYLPWVSNIQKTRFF